ncbi:uncharacterized protein LOC131623289 [Vicia villosa]|uniref:uncharacterized protein LOC131623289 n=1 Tax=Vicia villosa TaxID=3911 RepID=UPI00273CA5C8|nr:uncharacterized protein LOC131623289 [Vicia villosa]
MVRFKILFSIFQIQDGTVGEVGRMDHGSIIWDLKWRHSLFVHEKPIVDEFFQLFKRFTFSMENNRWMWRHARDDSFSMVSVYQAITSSSLTSDETVEIVVLTPSAIWESWGPFKVMVFSWKLLRDKFSSKKNLFKQNVITV